MATVAEYIKLKKKDRFLVSKDETDRKQRNDRKTLKRLISFKEGIISIQNDSI